MGNKLGIAILNYNGSEETISYCKHIPNYEAIDCIIVVYNNSTDVSVNNMKIELNDMQKVVLLLSPKNKGYTAENNIGIKYL